MSSVIEDLGEILEIKKDLYTEISSSDVSIESSTPFSEYPTKVRAIVQSSSGGGISVDAYSKTESDEKFALKEYEHIHENKDILDDLSVVNTDTLLFRNKPAGTIATKVFNNSYSGAVTSLSVVINVKNIFNDLGASAVYSQQISVKNTSDADILNIQVLQEDLVLLDVDLQAGEVQSYNLNHSSDLTIQVKGNYKIIYDLIAF